LAILQAVRRARKTLVSKDSKMPMPVRSLPTVQNWDCRSCSDCCRTYSVPVTAAERETIAKQAWSAVPGFEKMDTVVKAGGEYALAHTAEGACVFLGDDNRCRIHAKFGAAAKPKACRIYPFVMVPAGDHWRVGIRFACPTATANQGRKLAEHAGELAEFAGLLEADASRSIADLPPPPLQAGQSIPWVDLLRFNAAISEILNEPAYSLERRLRQISALAEVCKKSRFGEVQGDRLKEFLDVMGAAIVEDVPIRTMVPKPGWVGRMLFRQLAAVYCRKDNGPDTGIASRGKWTRIRSAWRFARGTGAIPKLHARIPTMTFADAEEARGSIPAEIEALLLRYYRVKVESLQFCGPTNYHRPYWEGLDSLLMTFPAILWLARVFERGGLDRTNATKLALRLVDDSFGYNKLLDAGRQPWAMRALADRGEIAKLIAWYAG